LKPLIHTPPNGVQLACVEPKGGAQTQVAGCQGKLAEATATQTAQDSMGTVCSMHKNLQQGGTQQQHILLSTTQILPSLWLATHTQSHSKKQGQTALDRKALQSL